MQTATSDGALDFDAKPDLAVTEEAASSASSSEDLVGAPLAMGLSLGAVIVAAILCYFLSRSLAAGEGSDRKAFAFGALSRPWHALSLLVCTFLALNVGFGGATALLLNGKEDDARAYFAEISALKLARMSHEHFFGYALLFGTMGALALGFVGNRRRVVFPLLAAFAFAALDVASWWLARYAGFGFHTLSYLTGGGFALAFLALYVQVARVNFAASFPRRRLASKESR